MNQDVGSRGVHSLTATRDAESLEDRLVVDLIVEVDGYRRSGQGRELDRPVVDDDPLDAVDPDRKRGGRTARNGETVQVDIQLDFTELGRGIP